MSTPTQAPKRAPVERHLARLRRRAGALYALRAALAAGGAGGLTFALLSALTGPAVGRASAAGAWALVVLAAAAGGWVALRGLSQLRGPRVASLLQPVHGGLASAARSAVELTGDVQARALSPALVQAHSARVHEAMRAIRPAQVVTWRTVRHPAAVAGGAAALLAGALALGVDSVASGAWALLHPSVESDEGVALAAVVGDTRARLSFPEYMDREPQRLHGAAGLEAPRGTSVRYSIRPRVETKSAVLHAAGRDVRLVQGDDGWLQGQFVVRNGGPVRIRVERPDGRWLEDPTQRWIRATKDQAPRVALTEPEADRTIELSEPVTIRYDASDDVGLREVELVIDSTAEEPARRPLTEFAADERRRRAAGHARVVATDLGAQPGDRLQLWIEARDGDVVSGPNVGKSEKRTLVIASEATRRLERLGDLKQALDRGLDALADRLENPVAEGAEEARNRFDAVQGSGERFATALAQIAEQADDTLSSTVSPAQLRSMARRVRRLQQREASAHRGPLAPHARRSALDGRLVEELEDDTLELADLLGQARIEDAAELTRELERLRREMSSLLAELRRTDNPRARQQLMAALSRAEARMRELMQRLSQMGEDVPSDFVNADALQQEQSQDALASMREALERGDLSSAEKQLMELERQISAMAEALGNAEQSFAEDRFGPEQRALAEAMDRLAGLETEQRQLARRSEDVRRSSAERALEASGAMDEQRMEQLAEAAREARKALDEIEQGGLGPMEREAFDRAEQRLRDTEDALRSGDLGEARRMAHQGSEDLERLARDLELSALMFPGHEGRTSDGAGAAKRASRKSRELGHSLDEALPKVDDFVDEQGRRQMAQDVKRQRKAEQSADELQQQFAEGPDGSPLSPEAIEKMKKAREQMRNGRSSLERGDPVEASRAQEDAARRLTELREELERNRRGESSSGGGSDGGDGRADPQRRVEIPGSDSHDSPMQMRRRLLDAMREDAPDGYDEAVRRYYEELLR